MYGCTAVLPDKACSTNYVKYALIKRNRRGWLTNFPRNHAAALGQVCPLLSPVRCCANGKRNVAQRLPYSSWRRHQTPCSLRPLGSAVEHWYMTQGR